MKTKGVTRARGEARGGPGMPTKKAKNYTHPLKTQLISGGRAFQTDTFRSTRSERVVLTAPTWRTSHMLTAQSHKGMKHSVLLEAVGKGKRTVCPRGSLGPRGIQGPPGTRGGSRVHRDPGGSRVHRDPGGLSATRDPERRGCSPGSGAHPSCHQDPPPQFAKLGLVLLKIFGRECGARAGGWGEGGSLGPESASAPP